MLFPGQGHANFAALDTSEAMSLDSIFAAFWAFVADDGRQRRLADLHRI
jgi:hypothetical protein